MSLIHEFADFSLRIFQKTPFSKIGGPVPYTPVDYLELFFDYHPHPGVWLNDRAAQDDYYSLLKTYFARSDFHRESFLLLVKQLRDLNDFFPEIVERLWLRPNERSSELILSKPASGRALNHPLWRIYRSRWLRQLEASAAGMNRDEALKIAADLEKEIKTEIEKNSKLPRAERDKAKGHFFSSLRKEKDPQRLASYLILSELVGPRKTHLLKLDDSDLILDYFEELRADVQNMLERFLVNPPDFLSWKIKSILPDPGVLLKDHDLFPRITSRTFRDREFVVGASAGATYKTTRVRGIHGVFSGVAYHDCLGGNFANLSSCSTRRWAIGGLSGSKTYFIERNGRSLGNVRLIEVVDREGRRGYSSDICVPAFNSRALPGDGQRSLSLFDAWLPRFQQLLKNESVPLLISQSRLSDIAQVKPTIWNSDAYGFGNHFANFNELKIADPNCEQYLQAIRPGKSDSFYGHAFVTDCLFIDAGQVQALNQVRLHGQHGEV